MMKTFFFLIFAFALGCASKTVKDPTAARQLLFPYGTYQHDVDVHLAPDIAAKAKDQPGEFHFRGAVLLSEKEIKVVALSAMGTTLFRISEDRTTGKVETEIYVDALKKVEDRMKEYYGVIREVLTTPLQENLNEVHVSKETPAGPTEIDFRSFDKNGIPTTVDVENAKFEIRIKVLGYEI